MSRVGGAAQIKSMKKVAGTLKIDQAQYRELEAFAKFSSDMDAVTAMTIDRGRKNNQLLIQAQYSPMPVAEQVAILYCGTRGLLKNVPLNKVRDFQEMFLQVVRSNYADTVLAELAAGNLSDKVCEQIKNIAAEVAAQYKDIISMASLKEVKTRIASVNSTRKITSAMKMVASSKLHRAQQAIENMRPYERQLTRIMSTFVASMEGDEVETPYAVQREVKRVAIVLYTSNTSLCGGFNANAIKAFHHKVEDTAKRVWRL